MRVSIWKQDRKGVRWRRIGVVIVDLAGPWWFKKPIPHGASPLRIEYPRYCWYTMESVNYSLFGTGRRTYDA